MMLFTMIYFIWNFYDPYDNSNILNYEMNNDNKTK